MALLVAVAVAGCGKGNSTQATPTPAPTPAPTATPTPSPIPATPTPGPTVAARNYSGAQQAEYIKTAQNAFIEERGAKVAPFLEANKAFNDAGGASAKGLTSKEAITQRRAMIAKCIQTNADYLAFASEQANAFQAQLAKTPLIKEDIDGVVAEFTTKSNQDEIKDLRETVGESFQVADAMMVFLDKRYGAWTFNNGRISFKKPADANGFSDLSKKYSALATKIHNLQLDINSPQPVPGASPTPTATASPSGAVVPPGAVTAPTTSPAP